MKKKKRRNNKRKTKGTIIEGKKKLGIKKGKKKDNK
jgi:hypothetical protein